MKFDFFKPLSLPFCVNWMAHLHLLNVFVSALIFTKVDEEDLWCDEEDLIKKRKLHITKECAQNNF